MTGTHVSHWSSITDYKKRTDYLLSPLTCMFLPCLTLSFLFPLRRPYYAGIFLAFVLLRPCSSNISLSSTYTSFSLYFCVSLFFLILWSSLRSCASLPDTSAFISLD